MTPAPHPEHGAPVRAGTATAVLEVSGVHWATSKNVAEAVLSRRPGVLSVEANPVAQTATVTYDRGRTDLVQLRDWVRECGYHCAGQSVPRHVCDPMTEPGSAVGHHEHLGHGSSSSPPVVAPHDATGHGGHGGHGQMSMADMARDLRNRFLVALVLSVPIALYSPMGRDMLGFDAAAPFGARDDVLTLVLSLPVVFYSAWIFFDGAWRALRARTLDMMVLVAVAVGAGWLYSLGVTLTGGGDVFYEAATMLTAFVLLGHWFEMRARGGANDAIRTLLDLAPPVAVVLRDGQEIEVPTSEVAVGDLLLVRPGSRVATDGLVEDGESEIDESMVTGESLPVPKGPGDPVIGATVNTTGTLRVRATKVGADTALAQIVALVQEAQNSKAPGQKLADRAAFWLVLVALVLGAKRGILFKNATAIESAARIDTVVMDKTGTLTRGEPEVTDVVVAPGVDEHRLLSLVAAVERESEHPLARAVAGHADTAGVPKLRATGFSNVAGHGAVAEVDGHRVVVGNRRLMDREHVDLGGLADERDTIASGGRTAVLVAVDGVASAVIGLADAVRATSGAAVAALHEAGVRVAMLTGDNEATARRIADRLGIDDVIAEVLPEDKAAKIVALQRQGRRVAHVGDGVNDAPALAAADVGIAIGAGTDVAIETADVVLMRSDPFDVPTALTIGRGTRRKELQSLGWAIGYNAIALPIAAGVFEPSLGLTLRPEVAAMTMSGSSILVAVNALLLKRLRLPAPTPGAEAGATRPQDD